MANKIGKMNASISDEEFIKVCNESRSMKAAAEKLQLAMTTFRRRAKKLGCYKANQGLAGSHKDRTDRISLKDILDGKYPNYQTYKLKTRLILEGVKQDKCERCG